jgi:hypothetical protein
MLGLTRLVGIDFAVAPAIQNTRCFLNSKRSTQHDSGVVVDAYLHLGSLIPLYVGIQFKI